MFPWNKQFPFDQTGFTQHFNKMNPKEVENYIQSVMKNVFGGDFSQQFPFQGELLQKNKNERSSKQDSPEIFETNDYIYVKLPVSEEEIGKLKLQHTRHQFIVQHQSEETKHMLPAPVKRKGTKARYTDGFLEIQFIKLQEESISEVAISYE
ncbi:Hsp20/alpha crystallin family protein [uncultured Metabacillus sp.]|uniref:Hsp20/alpha crystallin family protein n=1 Tax=uncultured Metabacillus sp. TaxID=2860135 RepID=UPI0026336716|nr:Hsp20/alpha crystallin family protein [uncultured Metabacillus sp.]